ncbi:MAG: aminoacyl-tRNA hydrolase [Ruminococcaceae bacterium]|nr:aminoacyl-tRNA hydrolase [Oscillospiraceae bacterium]
MILKFKDKSTFEYLIVGLGNPGKKYEFTRHNAGFLFVDILSEKFAFTVKKLKFHALIGEARINGKRCLVMKPQTMMNCSGEAVKEACSFYKIPPENVIVVFDDISLDVGKLRIRRNGSAGGHNGIKSIINHLGSDNFPRIKVGVGAKPHPDYDLADWVLSEFTRTEGKQLRVAVDNACDAVALMVNGETERAMSNFNS